MEKFDRIEAGTLKLGDRFHLKTDKKKIVYQITGANNMILYNIIENKCKSWHFDKTIDSSKVVVFMRHTL